MELKQTIKKIVTTIIQWEARMVLKKYRPKIIAVTGSVGKTSTKDAIFSVMSAGFFVRKSEKSFNSEIGVPLTILGCKNGWNNPFLWLKNISEGLLLLLLKNHYPKWLILEVGADRPGDIEEISKWIHPDIVVMTALPEVPVHVEYFDEPDDVVREKEFLVTALKEDGLLILNHDDEKVLELKKRHNVVTQTVGFSQGSGFQASHECIEYEKGKPVGISFRIDTQGSSIPVSISGSLGKQHIYPVLFACAVGSSEGLDMASMAGAVKAHTPPNGRMRLLEGIKDTTIIDDTYNASPAATQRAVETLGELTVSGKKIVALGDMMELGTYSVDEHKKIGELVAEHADYVVTVGIRAKQIAETAHKKGIKKKNIYIFNDSDEAKKPVELMLEEGDAILVKGSQSIRMEKIVEEIMLHPEEKETLLVRQESEWLRR